MSLGWVILLVVVSATYVEGVLAQSGRATTGSKRSTVINVIARRVDDPSKPRRLLSANTADDAGRLISKGEIELYDGGVFQTIEAFSTDPTPARIVVLMDNSATVQTDVKKLASVPAAFAPEIYEGDKVMVVGYDLKPEIITEFTDEPKDLQGTLNLLRKTDQPRLFDALHVILEDVLRPQVGFSKRVIVVVADGLDRGSKIKFDQILGKLQEENVTVYAIAIRDRTRGALRKDAPKPEDVLEQLVVETGGKLYGIEGDVKSAVKEICDELRNDRYQLTYYPDGISPIVKRRILVSTSSPAISLRYKASHPPKPQ